MSPVEIPGSVMKFLTRAGKRKCPNCKKNYRFTKVRQKNGAVYKHCPNCNHTLAKFSLKTLLRRERTFRRG